MPDRRGFLAGLLATGLIPAATWADAGSPEYLSAGRLPNGGHVLCGLDGAGTLLFQIPLPDRGHAAAAHPNRPEAVAFARRPGTFAEIIDCVSGRAKARLSTPEGRHFYGHGAFSADGSLLFTTENDFDAGQGRIGVWDAAAGYRRIDEFASGGVGPHEILLVPGTETLVVANGGLETHPDSERVILNLPTMRPNLAYVSTSGRLLETVEPEAAARRNSIRHLSVLADGLVAAGCQWQDTPGTAPALLLLHRQGGAFTAIAPPEAEHRRLAGYVGSVAFSRDGSKVAVTSPPGGVLEIFDVGSASHVASHAIADAGGVSDAGEGFLVTAGTGDLVGATGRETRPGAAHPVQWDNHLVRIRQVAV